MRVALLIGANPRLVKSGPLCILNSGKEWDYIGENVKDSEYSILDIQSNPILAGIKKVQVIITKPGTEKFISIFAESKT